MSDEHQVLLSTTPVPRWSARVLSLLAHVAVVGLVVAVQHAVPPHLAPNKYREVDAAKGSVDLALRLPRKHLIFPLTRPSLLANARTKRPPGEVNGTDAAGLQVLRGRAKRATTGLMSDLRFRQIYGFSPGDYQLPVRTQGEVPDIPASDVPPGYEQFLIVEITIDIDGHVADARLVTGQATHKIERTLLSAIREFKYIPAKRDGSPIPSQLDIVVHVPG